MRANSSVSQKANHETYPAYCVWMVRTFNVRGKSECCIVAVAEPRTIKILKRARHAKGNEREDQDSFFLCRPHSTMLTLDTSNHVLEGRSLWKINEKWTRKILPGFNILAGQTLHRMHLTSLLWHISRNIIHCKYQVVVCGHDHNSLLQKNTVVNGISQSIIWKVAGRACHG